MPTNTAKNTIVLLGVGHTNAHIVKMWKMQPIPDTQLICISNYPIATYSGMLPGVLSGQYRPEKMEIDLVRLCAAVGVRLIIADVVGIDHQQQRVQFADRPDLSYDFLSIGIGSAPSTEDVTISGSSLVAAKPMQTLLRRLHDAIDQAMVKSKTSPAQIAVVGGGIGSIEIAFCLKRYLDDQYGESQSGSRPTKTRRPRLKLITGRSGVGSGLLPKTRKTVTQRLAAHEIELRAGQRVTRLDDDQITLEDGNTIGADVVIWATHASPPTLLSKLDFAKDERGFLLTHPTLQTITSDHIFAVGDTGTIKDSVTDKAGVFAVRQGPVLWDNLKRLVTKQPLKNYVPQRDYLKLINTADGKSIAQHKGRTFYARWCWWLKDRIDQKFMTMYQNYEVAMMPMPAQDTESEMRCLGCGGKIGSQLLSAVLGELSIPDHPSVIIGLANPDDAAVVKTIGNEVTVTTDFFASPFDDPYLVGRIALLNSASDCFVMGAQPTGVLAIVQLPLVHSKAQLQIMRELMGGSVEEINRMGGAIVGGHSIEGPRMTIGFTVLGDQIVPPQTKGMLKPGDHLILTKPLGSGVLLAALMQARLSGHHYQSLVHTMLKSNQIALELLKTQGVSGVTDVTGFGLAGHLQEMLTTSSLSAELELDKIPLLPGAAELINEGIESTMVVDNRLVANKVALRGKRWETNQASVLFDPQTSGGILLGARPSEVDKILSVLHDQGFESSAVIGQTIPTSDGGSGITLN